MVREAEDPGGLVVGRRGTEALDEGAELAGEGIGLQVGVGELTGCLFMAVYQTRAWFLREYGYIADNPAVGPLLAEKYWAPGNSLTHDETLRALTGEGFSARYLAEACNRSVDEAWAEADASIQAARARSYPGDFPAEIDAKVRIVDGAAVLADNSVSEAKMCADFAAVVKARYPKKG